jgi:type III restriction enzyme
MVYSHLTEDHLGLEIFYMWQGQLHTYFPVYIIKFEHGRPLIVEIKGQKRDRDTAK